MTVSLRHSLSLWETPNHSVTKFFFSRTAPHEREVKTIRRTHDHIIMVHFKPLGRLQIIPLLSVCSAELHLMAER